MQKILQQILKTSSLQKTPVETLEQMTSQYPFFAVGQYLLAKKLQDVNSAAYEKQFQKTLIYFHNPLWLQYKLSEQTTTSETPVQDEGKPGITAPTAEAIAPSHDLIEEVVFRQQNNYPAPETMPGALQMASEVIPGGQIPARKEPEKQTIQREEPFTFQAYYTVDYFASQGIKLSQDSLQQDKLGKQLKSFTEWLKTMRRLPETSVVEILDKINDGEIAQIAAHSLEENEVVTEAMAEVLVKQGKTEKAKEVYNKLSLLHPHKSTYFAAKIEDLKQL